MNEQPEWPELTRLQAVLLSIVIIAIIVAVLAFTGEIH